MRSAVICSNNEDLRFSISEFVGEVRVPVKKQGKIRSFCLLYSSVVYLEEKVRLPEFC